MNQGGAHQTKGVSSMKWNLATKSATILSCGIAMKQIHVLSTTNPAEYNAPATCHIVKQKKHVFQTLELATENA